MSRGRQTPDAKRARWQQQRKGRVTTEDELKALRQAHDGMAQDFANFVAASRGHLPPDLRAVADRILSEGFGVDVAKLPQPEPEPANGPGLVVVGG